MFLKDSRTDVCTVHSEFSNVDVDSDMCGWCTFTYTHTGSGMSEMSSVAGDTDMEVDSGGMSDLLNTLR